MKEQTFGERLREARKRQRLTTAEFARLAEVSGPGAQLWETGRLTFPRADTLVRLAEILKVDLRWLITGEGSPGPLSADHLQSFPLETMMQAIANKGFDVTVVARGLPQEGRRRARRRSHHLNNGVPALGDEQPVVAALHG